jgi:hypothetical protein
MVTNEHNSMPYMKSLATCLNKMVLDGYTADFGVSEQGLKVTNQENRYLPQEIEVVNFFRFEGESDPSENAILYVIETADGTRGTLIDAFGVYSDARINAFMKEVPSIQKKVFKN